MTDDFTEAARAEAERVHFPVPTHRTPSAVARASAAAFRDGASWARTHLARQEVTAAEVEAAARELWRAVWIDPDEHPWESEASEVERRSCRREARAALTAARAVGRDAR